jgi:hypothetical protein
MCLCRSWGKERKKTEKQKSWQVFTKRIRLVFSKTCTVFDITVAELVVSRIRLEWWVLSGGVPELADGSVFNPRDPGKNLGIDRKYFHIRILICRWLTLEHYLLIYIYIDQ